MKLRILGLVFAVGLCSFTFIIPSWSLKKNKDGIKVYTAEKEGSSIKQCKSTISIKTQIQDVCDYLLNPSNFKNHSEKISKVKVLTKDNKQATYYMQVDLPWPTSDRDGFYKIELVSKSAEKAELTIKALPDLMEEVESYVRVQVSETKYYLKKNGDKVDIELYIHTEPGGNVPSWLANYYVEDSPFNALSAIRKKIEEK